MYHCNLFRNLHFSGLERKWMKSTSARLAKESFRIKTFNDTLRWSAKLDVQKEKMLRWNWAPRTRRSDVASARNAVYESHWDSFHPNVHRIEMFDNGIACHFCPRYFTNFASYRVHVGAAHHNAASTFNFLPLLSENLSCSFCEYTAPNEPTLRDHVAIRHDYPVDSQQRYDIFSGNKTANESALSEEGDHSSSSTFCSSSSSEQRYLNEEAKGCKTESPLTCSRYLCVKSEVEAQPTNEFIHLTVQNSNTESLDAVKS